jgi:hypothetical protein
MRTSGRLPLVSFRQYSVLVRHIHCQAVKQDSFDSQGKQQNVLSCFINTKFVHVSIYKIIKFRYMRRLLRR